MILDDIIAASRIRVAAAKEKKPLGYLAKSAEAMDSRGGKFASALTGCDGLSIIGEIKKASPSKGLIRADFDHMSIAAEYAKSDVSALSVLTEPDFFKGSLSYISDIKAAVDLPVLRKDFIIDEYQIYEAKAAGADAILLIMAALSNSEYKTFYRLAESMGLDCLVETHSRDEVLRAAEYAAVIGINNRNLQTFEEKITTTEALLPFVPKGRIIVSESAVRSHNDYTYLEGLGIDGILVGEAFMREKSVSGAVRKLRCGE